LETACLATKAGHCDHECAGEASTVKLPFIGGRQEGLEPLDRAYDLSS
jgi:hypothetical protein